MSGGERHGGAEVPPEMWDRLAELVSGPQGLETVRLLQRAGLVRPAPEGPRPPAAPAAPAPSGRPAPRSAGGRRRICLLGESAAAGFFYAPLLTPAKLLERQLAACGAAGAGTWEVVDLAQAGMQLAGLIDGTAAALRMEPDVVVVFAGNNWLGLGAQPFDHADGDLDRFQEYADAVERWGPGAFRRLGDEAMRARARQAVDRLAALAAAAQTPLVFVVPAANLVDFENCQPVFWLAADGVARWHGLYRRAVEGLRQGDLEAAAAAAREMLDLDGGDCATGHRLLASALLAQGRSGEAHAPLAAHFDASCWDAQFGRGSSAPAPVREELLAGCRRHGVPCVDLPSVFAELTGSPLTDRRLFLDHCHLTAEGMHVAMAAVSVEVLRAGGAAVPGSWRELAAMPEPELPTPLAALSRLHAALYNAHMNRPVAGGQAPIAEALMEEALAAACGAGESMRDYMKAMAAPGRAFLTAACERNQRSAYPLQPLAWLPSDLGIDALEPMARVLERRGAVGAEELDRILLEHHAVDNGRRDIAAPRYREQEPGASGTYALRQQPPAIFRALWPASTFFLVTAGGRDLHLDITLRLPTFGPSRAPRGETVEVSVNGSPAGAVQATERWSRQALRVEPRSLRRGLNRVSLSWPLPRGAGDAAIHTAVERLRQGLPAEIYPVFGEVFSLFASPPPAGEGAR
jgi:hypothetical protein